MLNGALPQGNRGIVMFTEGFKNPRKRGVSSWRQRSGKRVPLPAPLVAPLHRRGARTINSNEAEYNAWIADPA